ncbi:MAG: hypothetical protein LUD51_06170 [Clostridia bacterium]|nr:hypothetical protein [Clostridia bacterium]
MPPENAGDYVQEHFMTQVLDDIKHMTAYDGDEICISVKDRPWMEIRFVRICNDRRFGRTNLLRTEVHERQDDGSVNVYVHAGDRYDTVCGMRDFLYADIMPWDMDEMDIKAPADAEYGVIKDDNEKQRLTAIVSNYMNGNANSSSLFPEYWKALDRIMDYAPDTGYSKEIVDELWEKDFAKILEFAKRYPYDPVFAKAAGDIAMSGYIGPRDVKKAHRYYKFASERGYLAGRLALAEMYRDGTGVKEDYDKYASLVLSIYEDFVSAGGDIAMVCINYAIPEIARVYMDHEEFGNAGEAVIRGLSSSMSLWPYGIPVNETDAELADLLYKIYKMPEDQHELADLLVLLKSPCRIRLAAEGQTYEIEAVQDGKDVLVKYDGKYYRDPVSFMNTAPAGDKLIRELKMESMKVIKA